MVREYLVLQKRFVAVGQDLWDNPTAPLSQTHLTAYKRRYRFPVYWRLLGIDRGRNPTLRALSGR